MSEDYLLQLENVKKYFSMDTRTSLKAVDNISFNIRRGEILALVGESGCGKSTLGRTIMGIYPPTEGRIIYNGKDMASMTKKERKPFAKKAQMIFQDPFASLNPRKTVGDIVAEGLDIHGLFQGKERQNRISELLELVGLSQEHMNRYPHEFSGGQRQRIGIARALSLNPEFLVCDEPISALDVSIQAQIVNLMKRLQKQLNLTYLFIAHDLNMVRYIGDRIAVMYLGNLMEIGESNQVYGSPKNPYTKMLIDSVPIADPKIEKEKEVFKDSGEIPSPINPPKGCVFCTRCPHATVACRESRPLAKEIDKGHFVACHLY